MLKIKMLNYAFFKKKIFFLPSWESKREKISGFLEHQGKRRVQVPGPRGRGLEHSTVALAGDMRKPPSAEATPGSLPDSALPLHGALKNREGTSLPITPNHLTG